MLEPYQPVTPVLFAEAFASAIAVFEYTSPKARCDAAIDRPALAGYKVDKGFMITSQAGPPLRCAPVGMTIFTKLKEEKTT